MPSPEGTNQGGGNSLELAQLAQLAAYGQPQGQSQQDGGQDGDEGRGTSQLSLCAGVADHIKRKRKKRRETETELDRDGEKIRS